MPGHVLVVGGAGYIGSHMVKVLERRGYTPVVLDDLSTGYRRSVAPHVTFIEGRASNSALVARVLKEHKIDAIMHFAARALVSESVADPFLYYERNVAETVALLRTMRESGVMHFVFSSTCASYGVPAELPIHENLPKRPINPYGKSKLMVEEILADAQKAYGMHSAILRYFNAAGADPDGSIGEDHDPETHLIPNVLRSLTGRNPKLVVYGNDYDTADGTCIRDYIHVNDLAEGHIAALEHIKRDGGCVDFNLGTGNGHSNLEILKTVERVTGRKLNYSFEPRRAGDPPVLVADPSKARKVLGWSARHDIDSIVATAWAWEQARDEVRS